MIPFNKPYVPETSKKYALEALGSEHQQGDGPFTKRASKMVSDLVGGGHVLLTPSCTHALEMASMLGNFSPGDEVILPSYTFTSAATAVTKFGATPVFVDIDPITKGIDANQVAEAVTEKTVAISWVNYAGVAPDIDALQSIARKHDLLLIEDNAHGLGGSYKGKPLGSFGHFATQSFHATKNIQCGEGGALVVNSSKFIERAEIIREKGTDRKRFIEGTVQKYQWVDNGSSYLLAETLAAVLLGQLETFQEIQDIREKQISAFEALFKQTDFTELQKFSVGNNLKNSSHMFYLELSERHRASFMDRLSQFVSTSRHYVPLHDSNKGREYKNTIKKENESNIFSQRVLRFPVHSEIDLSKTHINATIEFLTREFC
jgi:dTDP-4-amino-4,6-dideoxygalactose transaminase